ncbi:DUF4060 family protein [Tatumella sp. UCD-D_suzukii]|uniref:DUF4060 family protein n=1 Tax=Tatumella sp. UCD-D_suzukii TaxID=1408192 RepID=UPI000AC2767B|nr:DUF4060 family protein [Tatumella sp. UCD-D_suzukii]
MQERIRGACDKHQELAAKAAIEHHRERYSQGRRITHCVKCNNRHYQVEVIIRKTVITATIINGYRPLSKIFTN